MTADDQSEPTAFLDANVLAKPFSRTLVWASAALSGYRVAWSQYVEAEAQKHLGAKAAPLAALRKRHDVDLSPTGSDAGSYASADTKDRQVLADAVAAGATFLVTENVSDSGLADLTRAGIVAAHPDLFMAHRTSRDGYAEALEGLSRAMTTPSRTPAVVHAAVNRRHPQTFAAFHDLHDVAPSAVAADYPDLLYRGDRCVRCLRALEDATGLRLGLDPACRAITKRCGA